MFEGCTFFDDNENALVKWLQIVDEDFIRTYKDYVKCFKTVSIESNNIKDKEPKLYPHCETKSISI